MLNKAVIASLILTIFLLPWYIIRFSIAGIPTTLLEIAVLATIALWSASLAVKAYSCGLHQSIQAVERFFKRHWPIVVPVSLFFIAATISIFYNAKITAALGIYKAYIIEPILLFLVIITSVNSQKVWRLIIAAFMLTALQVSLIAITQQLLGWPNFAPNELAQGRSSATYNTANAVGLFLGPIILVAFSIGLGYRKTFKQFTAWLWMISGLGVLAILASKSDGALIALIGSVFALLLIVALKQLGWLRYKTWMRLVVLGLTGYIVANLLFMFAFNHPPHVANPYTRPGFSTFTIRQCTWEGTVNLLKRNPVSGSGLAGFSNKYVEHATCDAEPLVYPHNMVLNFWVETGMVGLISFMALVGGWLTISGKLLQQQGEGYWVGLGLSIVPVYWLIHGLVDVPYFKNDLAIEWWVLFGLVVASYLKIYKEKI